MTPSMQNRWQGKIDAVPFRKLWVGVSRVVNESKPIIDVPAFVAIFLCGLLWLERPGPIEASQMLGISRFSLPPIGNVGLVTFSLLEMVSFDERGAL